MKQTIKAIQSSSTLFETIKTVIYEKCEKLRLFEFLHIFFIRYDIQHQKRYRDVDAYGSTRISGCAARRYLLLGAPEKTGEHQMGNVILYNKADFRLAPSQGETSLQSNGVSHRLGANLESALYYISKRL